MLTVVKRVFIDYDEFEFRYGECRNFMPVKLLQLKSSRIFPALKHENYRYYFSGQLISLIGTWLQTVAQGWLVYELTKSPFLVGLIGAIQFLPILIFGIIGGVLADRFNKRRLLIFTQAVSLVLALILGTLTILGLINIWIIGILAFLLGLINAIDTPARQSFAIDLVGREHLHSAIALNIGSFNSARVIGPAVAGFLIAKLGVGVTFILNGLTFLGPLIALILMKLNLAPSKIHHQHPVLSIKIGLHYAYRHPIIKVLLLFTIVYSIFGFSYTTMLPVIADRVFHQSAFGLGLLFSSAGLGAVFGTILVSLLYYKFSPKKLLLGGSFLFTISLFTFALTSNFTFALIILFFSGVGFASQMALINTTIQNNVENHLRGRVMSIFTTCLLGMQPIGNLQIGYISEHFGARIAISLGATIIFLFATYLYFTFTKLENIEYSAIT